eukprot:3594905-Rhodomonas_salina.1
MHSPPLFPFSRSAAFPQTILLTSLLAPQIQVAFRVASGRHVGPVHGRGQRRPAQAPGPSPLAACRAVCGRDAAIYGRDAAVFEGDVVIYCGNAALNISNAVLNAVMNGSDAASYDSDAAICGGNAAKYGSDAAIHGSDAAIHG